MINERERRMLEDLERRTRAEDPAFAQRLGGRDTWGRWHSAWRTGTSVPVALLAVALSVVAFVLQLSALGVPLLVWAMVGAVRWLVVAQRTGTAPLLGPLDRT
jgi:hypothetical protein